MRETIETDRERERGKKQMVETVFLGGGAKIVHCTLLTCNEISISVEDTRKIVC